MLAIFPEISSTVKSGDLERLAVLVRTYFCGERATQPKLAIEAMLKQYGVAVVRMAMEDYGRIAVRDERGSVQCSVAIRDGLSDTDEIFLLAHLLGHFILHIQPKIARAEWNTSGFREDVLPSDRYTHVASPRGMTGSQFALEEQADRFAGAILMPAGMLKRAKEKLGSDEAIARIFGVSPQMVHRRSDDLSGQNLVGSVIEQAAVAITGARRERVVESVTQTAIKNTPAPQDDTAHMLREQHHKDAPVPRAIAAQSYSTSSHAGQSERPNEGPAEEKMLSGKGMERLREIARMLDKTGRP